MHTKRHVRITLDLECYSDFHPEDLDWNDILDLEGDEILCMQEMGHEDYSCLVLLNKTNDI